MIVKPTALEILIQSVFRVPINLPSTWPFIFRTSAEFKKMLFRSRSTGSDQRFQMTEFIYYIEGLMQVRQQELRHRFAGEGQHRADYKWLCTKKEEPAKLDPDSLFLIRKLASKLGSEECAAVAVKTENILTTTGKHLEVAEIPKLVIELLDDSQTRTMLLSLRPTRNQTGSILKRSMSHRIKKDHCVKFDNQPSYIVFSISKD